MFRLSALALVGTMALFSLSCSVIDDDVVEVGVLRLYPVHPAQGLPVLGEAGVQLAVWEISSATIVFPDITSDLAEKGPCIHFQSYISLTAIEGECSRGASVAVYETPVDATISLTTTLDISRITPVDLSMGGDLDGDGVLNEDDNCPMVPNGGDEQLEVVTDAFGDEIGLACAFDSTGGVGEDRVYFLDSEIDAVPDIADNCPFHDNPLQENTSDYAPDGIGDACTDEATVSMGGETAIDLMLELTAISPEPFQQLLVLDFGSDITGWNCNWNAGTCELDPASVRACVASSTVNAAAGCP
jgi:hypothetical protein